MQWTSTDFVKCASRLHGCAVFDYITQLVWFAPPKLRLCYNNKTNSEMNESESKTDHLQTRKTEISKQIRKNNDGQTEGRRVERCEGSGLWAVPTVWNRLSLMKTKSDSMLFLQAVIYSCCSSQQTAYLDVCIELIEYFYVKW